MGQKKINICLVNRRNVGEHYISIRFQFFIKKLKWADGVFLPSFYTHGARLSDTFGMSTTHVDCKHS